MLAALTTKHDYQYAFTRIHPFIGLHISFRCTFFTHSNLSQTSRNRPRPLCTLFLIRRLQFYLIPSSVSTCFRLAGNHQPTIMSDSLGAGGGAPLGRGRGALIKMLQEQQKLQLSMVSTHSSIATASSSGGSHSLTTSSTIDSGHGTAGPSLGRGRLLSQFTSLSLSSSSGPSTSVSSSVSVSTT